MDKAQLSKIGAALARAMDADAMMRIARSSGFCRRMRSVTPQELAVAVIAAMATQNTETNADVQRTFNALTGRTMAYKPFHKSLAKPAFPEFMRLIVGHLLDELVTQALRPMHLPRGKPRKPIRTLERSQPTNFACHPQVEMSCDRVK